MRNLLRNKHFIFLLIRTGLVTVCLLVVSFSFAWFTANGAETVGTSATTISAKEMEVIEISSESGAVSVRGYYNGETGLGGEGTRDAPFYISKKVTLEFTPRKQNVVTTTGIGEYMYIKSFTVRFAQWDSQAQVYTNQLPELTSVKATYNNTRVLYNSTSPNSYPGINGSTVSTNAALSAFSWRVAIIKSIHLASEAGTTIAVTDSDFKERDALSVTVTNSTNVAIPNPSNSNPMYKYYNKKCAIDLELRLYFLDNTSLKKSDPALRTPFLFSGYSTGMRDYTDMLFSGVLFEFNFNVGQYITFVSQTPKLQQDDNNG